MQILKSYHRSLHEVDKINNTYIWAILDFGALTGGTQLQTWCINAKGQEKHYAKFFMLKLILLNLHLYTSHQGNLLSTYLIVSADELQYCIGVGWSLKYKYYSEMWSKPNYQYNVWLSFILYLMLKFMWW